MTQYGAEQVTQALLQLVANGGNAARTAEQLHDGDFMVTESTLRSWKNDLHAEQYRRLEAEHGKELEREAVEQARLTVQRVGELERDVVERIGKALAGEDGLRLDTRDLPQTLRSLTDTKAKSIDRVLALTGRPVQPKDPGAGDVVKLLEAMAAKGYLRLAAGVELGPAQGALAEQGGDGSSGAGSVRNRVRDGDD